MDLGAWGLLVGAVVGGVFQYLLHGATSATRRMLSRDRTFKAFLGDWHTYHYTREEGRIILREELWRVTWRPWKGIVVRTSDPQRPDLVYTGRILIEGDVVCDLQGLGFPERYHMRLRNPIPVRARTTWGLKVGVDFDSNIFASIYLFSKSPLALHTAKSMLEDKLKSCARSEFLSLNYGDPPPLPPGDQLPEGGGE